MPDEDGFAFGELSAPGELLHHAVEAVHVFADLLDEEHRGGVEVGFLGCAERRADDRQVAAREASAGRARAVERVRVGVDTLPQSQQCTAQRFVGDDRFGGLVAAEAELARHGGMEALNAQPSQCQVEHCHVAEPDDPFWLLAQAVEVDERQQPYRAVTALEADDGFHAGIVDHRLQVGGALGIGACEIGLLAVGGMRPELNLQAPRFEALAHFCRVGLLRQFPRRGDDAHRVAGPQVGRADELRPGGWLYGVGVQCRGCLRAGCVWGADRCIVGLQSGRCTLYRIGG